MMDVDAAYAATAALVTDCDLREVVAPLPTVRGGFTSPYQGWRLALFPFVAGTMAFDQPLSATSLRQLALLLARLHESRTCPRTPALGRERVAAPFPALLRDCLRAVEALPADATVYQRRLRELLLREQTDLVAYLDELAQLEAAVRALPVEQVVTHGDLNLKNILVDARGGLYLVDWDGIALAPTERRLALRAGPFGVCSLPALCEPQTERLTPIVADQETRADWIVLLSSTAREVLADRPGMGGNDPPRDRPTLLPFPGEISGDEDLAFFNAMLADLARDYCVDRAHVFVTGFSSGGNFSQQLACLRPKHASAAAAHRRAINHFAEQ